MERKRKHSALENLVPCRRVVGVHGSDSGSGPFKAIDPSKNKRKNRRELNLTSKRGVGTAGTPHAHASLNFQLPQDIFESLARQSLHHAPALAQGVELLACVRNTYNWDTPQLAPKKKI